MNDMCTDCDGSSFVLRALRSDHEAHGSKLFHGPKKKHLPGRAREFKSSRARP